MRIIASLVIFASALFVMANTAINNQEVLVSAKLIPERSKRGILTTVFATFTSLSQVIDLQSGVLVIFDSVLNELDRRDKKSKLVDIRNMLGEMKRRTKNTTIAIQKEHANTKLFPSQKYINSCLTAIQYSSRSPTNEELKDDVLDRCKCLNDEVASIASFLNGNQGHFGSDLLEITMKDVDWNWNDFDRRITPIYQLYATAIGLLPIYFHLGKTSQEKRQFIKEDLIKTDNQIRKRLKECKNQMMSEDQVTSVMKRILEEDSNSLNDNQEKARMIQNYLSRRWNEKRWFVYVYEGVKGFNKHTFDSRLYHVFRVTGKNVIAKSYKPNELWSEEKKRSIESEVQKYCTIQTRINEGDEEVGPDILMNFINKLRYMRGDWKPRCSHSSANAIWEGLKATLSSSNIIVSPQNQHGSWSTDFEYLVDYTPHPYANLYSKRVIVIPQ